MVDRSKYLLRPIIHTARTVAAILAISTFLVACGGGGSSSGSSSTAAVPAPAPMPQPAPVAETVPLKLTPANMRSTGGLAVNFSEAILQVAQLVIDAIDQIRINRGLASSIACENGSLANYSLTDQGNDGKPSIGDSIRVSYSNCYQSSIDDVTNGEIVITLTNPVSTSGWDGSPSYAATVQFLPTFSIGDLIVKG